MEENNYIKKEKMQKYNKNIFLFCMIIGLIVVGVTIFGGLEDFIFPLIFLLPLILLISPFVFTFINLFLLFIKPKYEDKRTIKFRIFEITLIITGFFIHKIGLPKKEWYLSIPFNEHHSPIWQEAIPTIVTLFLFGVIGYLILAFTRINKTPKIITLLAISALYIGVFECIMWIIQVIQNNFLLAIFPLNFILIAIRLIYDKFFSFKIKDKNNKRNLFWSFLIAIPFLSTVIVSLVLFGQRPDYIIKAYTETADWTFSQQIAPPGYYYEEELYYIKNKRRYLV